MGGEGGDVGTRAGGGSNGARDRAAKLFVLDTNVILHDARCIQSFREHDVAIPITVLEELDRFKRGSNDLNAQAREFLRRLDGITGDVLAVDGAMLGEGLGRVQVVLETAPSEGLRRAFLSDSPDHRILATALWLRDQRPDRVVILVSKDTNLRLKAKSFGLVAQDYTSDKVERVDRLYTGKRTVENMPSELIGQFYANGGVVPMADVPWVENPLPNENFVLRNGSKSVLATYRAGQQSFARVEKAPAYGVVPRNAEQSFALDLLTNDDVKLVTLAGKAGTGKTLLALAAGLAQTLDTNRFSEIIMTRVTIPLGEDIGFLPGTEEEKMEPWMGALMDNLEVLTQGQEGGSWGRAATQDLLRHRIKIRSLNFMRGRTFLNRYLILDEAQNLTSKQMKALVTRAGPGTKLICLGNISQIDTPYLTETTSGLTYVVNRFRGWQHAGHVTLVRGERSRLADFASEAL